MVKVVLGVVWIWGLLSFFVVPGSAVSSAGRIVFCLLVAIHAVECLAFLPRFRRAGGSLPGHLLQTFAFGFLHVASVKDPGPSQTP